MAPTPLTESDLRTLISVSARLGSEVQLSKLLDLILQSAGELTDSPKGSILLHDERGGGLYFAAATGDDAAEVLKEWGEGASKRVPMKGSKAGSVFSTGESMMEDSLKSDQAHFKGVDASLDRVTESMVCVPLTLLDPTAAIPKRIGVIQILNKRAGSYTERDRAVLEILSNYAAVAIRNAELFRRLATHIGFSRVADPVEVAAELARPPHIERLTVFSADMRGFTQVCNALDTPEEIERLLSSFLSAVSDQVLAHDGIVNKMLGDGVLALFRGQQAPVRAVRTAFAVIDQFQCLRRDWNRTYSQDLSFLDIGIGITTGDAVMGTIGWGKTHDFTAIGKTVNLAFAFQSQARSPKDATVRKRLLVDQATFSAVEEAITRFEGPCTIELRKPDQEHGTPYKQYHLISMDGESSAEDGAATTKARLSVFLCHASQDKPAVRGLYTNLCKDGFNPWFDEENLVPGQDWELEIRRAVRKSDAVVVCLSNGSVNKEGYLQRELRFVLDVADEKPEGTIFVVPVKLEECELPDRLSALHWVTLSASGGYDKLKLALATRARQLEQKGTNPGMRKGN
jgi:adenylate cyclase